MGGRWVATKWWTKATSRLKTAKWHPLVPFSPLHITKQLNPWPNSSASRVVNHRQLSDCQREMEPFEEHPSTRRRLTSFRTSHSKSNLGNLQHQYLAELLIDVYSYRLMVKSVSCCCVLFLDSVTNAE